MERDQCSHKLKITKVSNYKILTAYGNLVDDDNITANIFNDHFANMGQRIGSQIPEGNGNYRDFLNKMDSNGR